MKRTTSAIGCLSTFLSFVLGNLLSTGVAYGLTAADDSPGHLLATIATPDRAGDRLLNQMASVVAAEEVRNYRPISALLKSPPVGSATLATEKSLPRGAKTLVKNSRNKFTLGRMVSNPKTATLPYKELLEKTAGKVRAKAIRKHRTFARYLDASRTGRAGKVFEASEAFRANQLLKRSGSELRIIVTAAEDAGSDAADLVMLQANGRESKHFQLKSSGKAAWDALGNPKYGRMTIVTHPEELHWLSRELRKEKTRKQLRNQPLSKRYARLDKALKDGKLTDEIVPGQKVLSRRSTNIKTENMLRRQWDATVATMDAAKRSRFGRPLIRPASAMMDLATKSRFVRPAVKTVKYASKIGGRMIEVGTRMAVGADFVFAGYGYYDTVTRYQADRLDHDLMVAKMAIHTGEMGIGTVGVILLSTPEPTGATKIAGVVVIVASVALGAGDISLDMVASGRANARQELLIKIDREQRHRAVLAKLKREAAEVHPSVP
jgi:hypothetical protein